MKYHYANITVNPADRTVTQNGETVALTLQETDLLLFLLKNAGRAVPRGELLREVWDCPQDLPTRTVDCHVMRLRKKLGLQKNIVTVFKYGYLLVA